MVVDQACASDPNFVRSLVRQNVVELGCFGRTSQCCRRRVAARNHLSDFVEVARPDELLVRDGAVAGFLRREFFLLELRVGSHAGLGVSARKMEHGHVERMEASERNELKLVAHLAEFLLEIGNGHVVELFLPVERR